MQTTSIFSNTQNTIHDYFEACLHQQRQFQTWKTENISAYLSYKKQAVETDSIFFCGNKPQESSPKNLVDVLLKKKSLTNYGGYIASIRGKTILINPGKQFLHHFHNAGFHIWDIDCILVTDTSEEFYEDLLDIHACNTAINNMLKTWNLPPHVISYYLHEEVYSHLAGKIKPFSREEISCVHSLSLFSSTIESVELFPQLFLEYQESLEKTIHVRLTSEKEILFGYTSRPSFDEKDAVFFSPCMLCCFGLHSITSESYLEPSLATFWDNCKSATIVLSEIDLSEGDIRLETLQMIQATASSEAKTILLAERNLNINLSRMMMNGPGLIKPLPMSSCKTIRKDGLYGPLLYLDASSIA